MRFQKERRKRSRRTNGKARMSWRQPACRACLSVASSVQIAKLAQSLCNIAKIAQQTPYGFSATRCARYRLWY